MPIAAYVDTRFPWFSKKYRSACMQGHGLLARFILNFTDFNEDCLYLNIFYPNRTWEEPTTRYPVVVHIHGGSFVFGSSHMYPGHVLASKGVVVVTINYRLGPFGFLSTGDFASIGNYGLWDQLLAMQWVRENIQWFRGDASRITLMGESAGAASVGLHMVSPVSREQDLFHQAIIMSGSDLSHWAVSDPDKIRARYYAIELGRKLGCPSVQGQDVAESQQAMLGPSWRADPESVPPGSFGNSSVKQRLTVPYHVQIDANALIRCLRHDYSAEKIMAQARSLKALRGSTFFIWTPVLDGTAGFLPRMPLDERKQGRFSRLPILAGVVRDEGSRTLIQGIYDWEDSLAPIRNFTDDIARRTIGNILNRGNVFRFNVTAEELYTRYTWWPNLANNSARWERMVALISDYEINAPLETSVRFHAAHPENPVYFYEFAYVSPNDTQLQPQSGVYHGAEQPFLLGFPFMNSTFWYKLFGPDLSPIRAHTVYSRPRDTNMSELVVELWTNFIKYSNPTPKPVKNITWKPYRSGEEGYLFMHLNSTMRYKFRPTEMAFWRERFLQLAELVPASPPLFYFPLFDAQLATIILGCLTILVLTCLIVFIILLLRRPKMHQFSHNACLSVPGAAPGSAFQTAFKDAFSREGRRGQHHVPDDGAYTSTARAIQPQSSTSSMTRTGRQIIGVTGQGMQSSGSPRIGQAMQVELASVQGLRAHPPPPPIPSDALLGKDPAISQANRGRRRRQKRPPPPQPRLTHDQRDGYYLDV